MNFWPVYKAAWLEVMEYYIDFIDNQTKGIESIIIPERLYKRLEKELMYMQDGKDIIVVLHAIAERQEYNVVDEIIGGLWLDEAHKLEKYLNL